MHFVLTQFQSLFHDLLHQYYAYLYLFSMTIPNIQFKKNAAANFEWQPIDSTTKEIIGYLINCTTPFWPRLLFLAPVIFKTKTTFMVLKWMLNALWNFK